MVVHPVAELALLSEELGEWPNHRHNGNLLSAFIDPLTEFHFRLTPFEDGNDGFPKPGESNRRVVSVKPM